MCQKEGIKKNNTHNKHNSFAKCFERGIEPDDTQEYEDIETDYFCEVSVCEN